MTDKPTQTDAELQSIIDDADAGPPTDNEWLCLECGRWTPWRHKEAHDHADGCKAPAIYAARRDWKARLNDYMAKWGRQATQDVVGEVVWADGVPNSIREVHLKDLPVGTKLYTSPQPAHSGEPVAYYQPDDPSSSSAFSWPGSERNTAHNKPLFTAPQPVEREPLTDEQSHALLHRMADESDKWAEGLSYEPTREQVSGWCVAFLMRELPAHGIKGGQHGVE